MAGLFRFLTGGGKRTTGPKDAATQFYILLSGMPGVARERIDSLPASPAEPTAPKAATATPTPAVAPTLTSTAPFTLVDKAQVMKLLDEFDQWNGSKNNPDFGTHVSWMAGGLTEAIRGLKMLPGRGSVSGSHLFDNAMFLICLLLRLLELSSSPESNYGICRKPEKETGECLVEVASCLCDTIFQSPSTDETMVAAKDAVILRSLKVLQQEDPSLFDLIGGLLASRCSSILLQRTLLTPQRELQLQILHLALNFVKGIQDEFQLLNRWDSFVQDRFFPRISPRLIVDFFNKPPVLYKQLSAKMPPQVSLSVLQGAVKLFERELRGADRESAQATCDLVVKSVYSICPGGWSIPKGNTEGTRKLGECYHDLLNLTCPSPRRGETDNVPRMGEWWYWLERVTLAAGLEDLAQNESITAPFLERTLQYGLEAIRSTLSEDTLKFFDASVTHFLQLSPPSSFAELQLIPVKILERKILQSVLESHANVWEPHQIGWVLDKYAQILVSRHNFDPQSGDPRVKFLPLRDLLYKSFKCSFIYIVPFIRVSLYCPEYSNLFSFEDDRDIVVLKDIMKIVDVKPLSRQFTNTVRSLFQHEMEKPNQRQSPLFFLMLKTFASLVVRCMMAVEEVMKLTPAVLSLLRFRDLHLDHPFFGNYETGCQQLCDTIREQVDRICDNRVTLQEVKAFAGDQLLKIVIPSNTASEAAVPPRKEPTVENTQYLQFVEICKTLFPDVKLPDMRQVYKRFLEFKEQLHHLQIVRDWLEQKGRVHLRPVEFDVNRESGMLCDMEQCCKEVRRSIPMGEQTFRALRYFLVNSSAFFEVYFLDYTKTHHGEKEVPPGDLDEIVGNVVRDLQQLTDGTLWLRQIKDLHAAAEKNKGSTEETQIIDGYFSVLHNYPSFIQEGLALMQYLECIPAVVSCCKQFNLYLKTAGELSELHHSLTTSQVSLRLFRQQLDNVKKQFGDILPHLPLDEKTRVSEECRALTRQKSPLNEESELETEKVDPSTEMTHHQLSIQKQQSPSLIYEKQVALTQLKAVLDMEKKIALEQQKTALEVEKETSLHKQRRALEVEMQQALRQQALALNSENQAALRKHEAVLSTDKHKALEQQKKELELEKESALQQQREAHEKNYSVLQQESALIAEKNDSLNTQKSALEHAYTLSMASVLETVLCGFQKGVMALVETNDLDLTRATFIANGSFGTVCKVPVAFPKWSSVSRGAHSAPTEVALKMMFNYSAGMRTLQLRTEFEREYEVAVMHPHWCFTNVFNHFRGDTSLSLIKESLRGDYTIVDANRNWVSGCREGRRAITVYQRTTFMTMELGRCTLESIIFPRLSNGEALHPEVSPTQAQSLSLQNQAPPLSHAKDLLQLAFCVLCAVDHLNTRGWFHCDIKPDNILLMERPHIKGNIWALCDLGTAVFCEDGNPLVLPKGETFTGNAQNRAPEVIQAEREFPLLKNDVWAVGCVLFEAVSGWHPFTNENQVNSNLIRDTTLPPVVPDCSSLTHEPHTDPTITPALVSGLVGWLLEREPNSRPTSRVAFLACGALLSLPHQVITTFVTHIQQQQRAQNPSPPTSAQPATTPSTQPPDQSTTPATTATATVQPVREEDLLTTIQQALLEVQKQTVIDVFQHNGLRFGTDVVPSVTSPTFEPLQATVNEVMSLVYCNMALRDVPAAARALISFLDAASSPRYNLNILS
ncbi:Protein kinase domain [Pelomyxa schiedti]|nr:Protein kinase domain [Pelomyxa schiedti]